MTSDQRISRIWRILRRIALWIAITLGLLAGAWYGFVFIDSRVSGERPVYLMLNSPEGITLRWGTKTSGIGEVHYGTAISQLDRSTKEHVSTDDHRIRLQGLQPSARYFYRLKHKGDWLSPQTNEFYTSPPPGQATPTRIWVLGDPGYANIEQSKVRDSALAWLHNNARRGRPDLDMIFTTGDNGYTYGSYQDLLRGFFTPYADVLKYYSLWTVFGNHDARRKAFYQVFDTPMLAQSGGLASQARNYYSFDYGNSHFIILDSHHGDLQPQSEMLVWLKKDLAATTAHWRVVLFHHPPYTRGTHNSDSKRDSRGRMIAVRENILPILEAAHVDLVLSGHSHGYERSHLLECHYGNSSTLTPAMQQLPLFENSVMAYDKDSAEKSGHAGTVYMVVGSSAKKDHADWNHPAMAVSRGETGSVVLDINAAQLETRFLDNTGQILDHLRITKTIQAHTGLAECEKRLATPIGHH